MPRKQKRVVNMVKFGDAYRVVDNAEMVLLRSQVVYEGTKEDKNYIGYFYKKV